MKNRTQARKGFTIVELMFATLVFSVVLLLCLNALVQMGRLYYKGVTTSETQSSARAVLDEISQAIQFSAATIVPPSRVVGPDVAVTGGSATANADGYFCVGTTRYSYVMDRELNSNPSTPVSTFKQVRHVLWADVVPLCQAGMSPVDLTQATPSAGGRELLGANMRITRLRMTKLSTNDSTWSIQLTVMYGDEDLVTVYPEDTTRKVCKSGQVGTQFCALSELSTIVKRRVL